MIRYLCEYFGVRYINGECFVIRLLFSLTNTGNGSKTVRKDCLCEFV
jgi:hypothetical protein